jgi:hypothetical protein
MKKKLKKSKGFQIQKETEMKFFIFHGKIILSANQKSVTKVYHSDLVTGTKMYRESTIVSGVTKCIGSVLGKFSCKKKIEKIKSVSNSKRNRNEIFYFPR